MPNWCNNTLTITHKDPAMIQRAYDALERGEFLSEFCPIPKELGDAIANGQPDADMIAKYGYSSWYDYCTNEWGTKWDVGEQGASDIHPDGTMLNTYFDSAWSPPTGAYEKLVQLGFTVDAYYYEGGMAYMGTWSDGVDDYIDLNGLSADEIEQDYPDLNDAFGIADSMREYEEPEELSEWLKDGIEQKKLLVSE